MSELGGSAASDMLGGARLLDGELVHLGSLWPGPLADAYLHYEGAAAPRLALAAALVEVGIGLHGLGSHLASPADLLLGDLCLARASRLVSEEAGRQVQIGFAKAIEQAAAHPAGAGSAASERGPGAVRARLDAVLGGRSL